MATISSVLTELLTEIDDICAGRGIKYAVTGKAAERIAGGGALDEEVVEPVVLMSGKGMTEFVEAFEQRDSERRIEYFGNSDRVNGLAVFYCAPDTTFIRVCNISLPDRKAIPYHRDIRKFHDAFLFGSACQVFILNDQHLIRHFFRHTDVHQRAQDTLFPLRIVRYL